MAQLRVLLVEDDDNDAALVMSAAKREALDVEWTRVDDERSFLEKLEEPFDAIVTDFNLPSFSALRVLELVGERGAEMPILVVTGALDDELAVECIKRGAADYLLKDRLARLRDALEGAIERVSAERQKRVAEVKLLAAAASRSVLNRMLLLSLSVDLSEPSLRAVVEPLFGYDALPDLLAVRVEVPGLASFRVDRPGPEGHAQSGSGSDLGEGSGEPIARVFSVVADGGAIGRFVFSFEGGVQPDMEAAQFLDETVYVLSGVIKRAWAEKSLRRSFAEQEELLREIHHRVKNNLATVQGLVSLKMARVKEGPGREALAGLEAQVRSMALMHEMAYARGGFTGIDFEDYLRELKVHVADEKDCPQASLMLEADCGALYIPLEEAVSLGILFNELFLLAAGRAVSGGKVELRVEAVFDGKDRWRLAYEESSPSVAVRDPDALASSLDFIRMLLEPYDGSMEMEDGDLRVRMAVHGATA